MSNKKNQPHIPLYIGDWEKDCNVLSLESESAWLRIIFKMFTNGKQSSYKIPTKGLQNLWRVSEEKTKEIIQELTDFNICEINIDGRFVEFTSRRYAKENELSEIRSNAVKSRYGSNKTYTNSLQNSHKTLQNADNDNDNDFIGIKEGGTGETSKGILPIEEMREDLKISGTNKTDRIRAIKGKCNILINEGEHDDYVDRFIDGQKATEKYMNRKDGIQHFINWTSIQISKQGKQPVVKIKRI